MADAWAYRPALDVILQCVGTLAGGVGPIIMGAVPRLEGSAVFSFTALMAQGIQNLRYFFILFGHGTHKYRPNRIYRGYRKQVQLPIALVNGCNRRRQGFGKGISRGSPKPRL